MNLLKQPIFNRWGKKKRGVSPVLATVIIFGLIITGVMVTFIQVIPYIEQAQSEQTISSVRNSFIELDNTLEDSEQYYSQNLQELLILTLINLLYPYH
ncbi:MAG: hypothetical protein ACTSQ9_05475 [Candidatus Hodarchaeales archaeon]